MDVAPMLSGSRWQILEIIGKKPSSPSEISVQIGSTVANVSTQLRLLEASGLVEKQRVPNRDAGQPRMLYGLPAWQSVVVSLGQGHVDKSVYRDPLTHYVIALSRLGGLQQHMLQFVCTHIDALQQLRVGLKVSTTTLHIGVTGETRLTGVATKYGKVVVKKVATLDGFEIQLG